jgi:hypothetical protein
MWIEELMNCGRKALPYMNIMRIAVISLNADLLDRYPHQQAIAELD